MNACSPSARAAAGQSLTASSETKTKAMANFLAVKDFLQEQHIASVKWHHVLNNTMSTRPRSRGGPVVGSVEQCKRYEQQALPLPSAGANVATPMHQCFLRLPDSFQAGDGKVVEIMGKGDSRKAASEDACCGAMVQLLCAGPYRVLLRPNHWKMPLQDLVNDLHRIANMAVPDAGCQPLAAPMPRGHQPLSVTGSLIEKFAMAEKIVRRCLETHGGTFDPSFISRRKYGTGPDETAPWQQLDTVLGKGEFRNFIEQSPDFQLIEHGPKGMLVTWATSQHLRSQALPAQQAASSSSMDQAIHATPGEPADLSSGIVQTMPVQMTGQLPIGQALPAQGAASSSGVGQTTQAAPGQQTVSSSGAGQTLPIKQCGHVLVGQTLPSQKTASSSDIASATHASPCQQVAASVGMGKTLPVEEVEQLPMGQSLPAHRASSSFGMGQATQAAPGQQTASSSSVGQILPVQPPGLIHAAAQNQGNDPSKWGIQANRWKKRNT